MILDDPRHGTVAGYNRIPCREACCRHAYASYRKVLEWDRLNGRRRIVEALGTRRRVQALSCIGWSQAYVARAAGFRPEHMPKMIRNDTIRADTAARIALVYDQLHMTLAPPGHSATYARNFADRRGWVPPLAWDDIDTDPAPHTAPELAAGRPETLESVLEDFEWLTYAGESPEKAAKRVGVELSTVRDYRTRQARRAAA